MGEEVTIVVVPRDRFSSVIACAKSIIQHTPAPYRLVFLDFGYSKRIMTSLQKLDGAVNLEIVPCGQTIPIEAFRKFLPRVETRYLTWIDNDTYVTEGWLEALLQRRSQGARVILPMTLECEGLDHDPRNIPYRVHISHGELRQATVDGVDYVFDYKPYRRAAPNEVPQDPHVVDFFELHTFFAETAVLRKLDLPPMVVREHIDIGIQLHKLGIPIWCEPKSVVKFDNIHARPSLSDLRFFFFRWNERLINNSHDLFEARWGYRFYNEQFMKNWAFRRKVFSVARYLGLPQKPADFLSRVFNKLLRPPLPQRLTKDPLPESRRVFDLEVPSQQQTARGSEVGANS
jgi:hypothetical protein